MEISILPKFRIACKAHITLTILFILGEAGLVGAQTTTPQEQGLVQLTTTSSSNQFPAWSPDGSMIYFASNYQKAPNSYDIWRVAPDGSGLTRITQSPTTCCDAGLNRVVPVGTTGDLIVRDTNIFHEWLYLHLSEAPSLPVVRSVLDGPSPYMDEFLFVPGGLSSSWLAVSPDTTNTAWDTLTNYLGTCPRTTQVRLAPTSSLTGQYTTTAGTGLVTGNLACTVSSSESLIGVSFSPDGSQFVIARIQDPNYYGFDLEIYNIDGTFVRKLTNDGGGPSPVINWNPSWSKDNRIAFSSNITGQFQLWTVNADGSNLTQVTTNGGDTPAWSPDASRIVFSSDRSGTSEIYSVLAPTPYATNIGSSGTPSNQQAVVAEPVSTGNGNYFYEHTDFALPGLGLPIVFSRSYNSLDNYSGPLGASWTDSYNIILTPTAGGAVIKWGDGHSETFTLTGGVYVPQPGVFSTLVKNIDGTFTLTKKDQTKYLFSAAGKLTGIEDRNGNATSLTYDASGNLVQIEGASGRTLTLSYDGDNRITQITDPIGRTVSFQYDGSDNLAQATDPAGGKTQYMYDSNHRVTSITLPNGNVLLKNVYDAEGRVVSQTNGQGNTWTFAFDTPATSETTITDPLGHTSIHAYDSDLRIVGITDAMGGTVSYTYDANNERTSLTNQDGNTTHFTYDSEGNVTSITNALGKVTSLTYDAKNDLLTATDPNGKTAQFSYDSLGNLVTIKDALGNTTTFAYAGFGEVISRTDARSNGMTYSYDAAGDLAQITDALGDTTRLGYDGIGRLVSLTDPNGHTATAAYDALSRLVTITDPLGHKTQFAYDPIGNLVKVTDADGNATGYAYDAANNLVTVTDAMGHVTRYAYDADNNRIAFTNGDGLTTSYAYDVLNRLVGIKDPLSFVTTYAYDPVGDVTSTTDPKGQTNQFTYDALNRLLTISYADGRKVAYSYDPDGNRTSMVDSHGTTKYTYDALDRIATVDNPGGKIVAYGYDAVGTRASITYPDGKTVGYTYDLANRLASVTDWSGQQTAYKYDPATNLVSISYPNQASVAFNYDGANRLVQVLNTYRGSTGNPISRFTYVLDPVGNRMQVTDGSGIVTKYGYNSLYELTSVNRDGKITGYTYDADGNRITMTAPGTSDTYIYDADDRLLLGGENSFTYDADGNETSKTLTLNAEPIAYSYDAANQLVAETGGGLPSWFAYDGDGNRISQTLGAATYDYVNDVASPLAVVLQESGPDGNISYAYGLGRISESSPAFDYFYHYDGLGSVVGLTDPSGTLAGRYVYDAWGNTVQEIPRPKIGDDNQFQFTGEALDPGTGFYYLRTRYYDPTVGRFLTRDPAWHRIHFPLGANKYAYALSNPERYIDPSGLGWFDAVLDFFLAYQQGQTVTSQIQAQDNCALSPNCTLNDSELNQVGQTQAQALQDLQAGGSEAGQAIYGGPNVLGPGPGGTAFDFTVFLATFKQEINDLLGLPGKIIQAITPTAQAAITAINAPTGPLQK